ncbi:MAG: aminotransferase class III-fold pyridoxal phosphate-dependent enzyme [Candidatus Aegiribacteria sp.]|nr:aminotransferase class III-fold pyridoxal phosphate-dependent enzyme [Candidatus Aegiribacteria sp.]
MGKEIRHAKHWDAVLHGWRDPILHFPTIIQKSGYKVVDNTGKSYLDLDSQGLVDILGVPVPEAVQAIKNTAEQTPFVSAMYGDTQAEINYADALLQQLGPGFSRIHFATSGSMAIEAATKIAKLVVDRELVVAFEASYHGASHFALSCSGQKDLCTPFHIDLADPAPLPFPDCSSCATMSISSASKPCVNDILSRLEEIGPSRVAAIVSEPYLSATCRVPCQQFWRVLKSYMEKHGILLIGDEVSTGFGRSGEFLGFNLWGVQPDLVVMGKGLSTGYAPISAVILTDQVAERMACEPFKNGTSFEGHAIGCAAASECLAFSKKADWLGEARRKAKILEEAMRKIFGTPPTRMLNSIRVFGLIAILELVAQDAERIKAQCRQRGIFVGGFHNYLRIAPGVFIDKGDLFHGLRILKEEVYTE